MTHGIAHSAEAWLRLLLVPSGKAALVAATAMVLACVFRKWMAPRWRHVLWVLVFARLLVPDVASWRWSAQRWIQPEPPMAGEPATRPFHQAEHVEAFQPISLEETDFKAASPVPPITPPSQPTPAPAQPLNPWEMAGLVWLGGAVLMLGTMLACSLRFHRRVLRGACAADATWRQLEEELGSAQAWRRVPAILVSPCLNSPVLAGLWRPRIVLPSARSMTALTPDQRRHLLLHEMAHWRRADLWLQTAASLLLAVHWFNPLIWLAQRRLRVESEACADAWVLRQEGPAQAREYGSTLLQLVTQSSSVIALLLLPGVLGMAGGGGELRERLTELALGQRRKRFWTLGALAVIALAGATMFTRPEAAEPKTVGADKISSELIHLEHADPHEIAKELTELFKLRANAQSSGGNVEFTPDLPTLSLRVSARPADMAYVRALVAELDEAPSHGTFLKRRFKHLPVTKVFEKVRDALASGAKDSSPRSLATNGSILPETVLVGKTLLIADPVNNTLFASGPAADIQIVRRVVDRMEHPASLHGRVLDEQGRPVAAVQIARHLPAYNRTVLMMTTGADGEFRYDDLVKDEPVKLVYQDASHALAEPVETVAGDPSELKLVLKAARHISGTVTNATDGKPVANARVYVGRKQYRSFGWAAGQSVLTDAQGHYQLALRSLTKEPSLVRVESDDHATFISAPTEFVQANNRMDAKLTPRRLIGGTVLDAHGKPFAGALVWLAEGELDSSTPVDQAWIDARLTRTDGDHGSVLNQARSDAAGRFQLKEVDPALATNGFLVAAHAAGTGRMNLGDFQKSRTIPMEPWNTLKARFVSRDGRPLVNQKVWAGCDGLEVAASNFNVTFHRDIHGTTDEDGRFTFQQILPRSRVEVTSNQTRVTPNAERLTFTAGEARDILFTTPPIDPKEARKKYQRQVVGSVALPASVTQPLTQVEIEVTDLDDLRNRKSYQARCANDGRFVVPGVAPGRYLLGAHLPTPDKASRRYPNIAGGAVEFKFDAVAAQPAFDVGRLELLKLKYPGARETLTLPKGPVGTVKITVRDSKDMPVSGATVSGQMLYPDYALVMPSDELARVKPMQTDAKGEAVLKYPRDLPGRDPIAAVFPRVEKPGLMMEYLGDMTDGESTTVHLGVPPVLEVQGVPPTADFWATFSSYLGGAVPLLRHGDIVAAPVSYAGDISFIITDQSDPKRWRFSPVEVAAFKSGEIHVFDGRFTPGVVIEGRVTGVQTPIQSEAWAYAQVRVESPVAAGSARSAYYGSESKALCLWTSWCPVNPDGTFTFAGVPRGHLGVHVVGPGWVMDEEADPKGYTMPYHLSDKDDVLKIKRPFQPAGKKRIQVLAPDGTPAAGAVVESLLRMAPSNNAFTARGHGAGAEAVVASQHRDAYLRWLAGATQGHRALSGVNGIAVLDNQPSGRTDFWITWKDPKSAKTHRREELITVGINDTFTYVVDLSKGVVAR